MSGMEGGENWSKVGSLGGRVSTLALILEGEICSQSPFGWSKFKTQCSFIKKDFLGFKWGGCC